MSGKRYAPPPVLRASAQHSAIGVSEIDECLVVSSVSTELLLIFLIRGGATTAIFLNQHFSSQCTHLTSQIAFFFEDADGPWRSAEWRERERERGRQTGLLEREREGDGWGVVERDRGRERERQTDRITREREREMGGEWWRERERKEKREKTGVLMTGELCTFQLRNVFKNSNEK